MSIASSGDAKSTSVPAAEVVSSSASSSASKDGSRRGFVAVVLGAVGAVFGAIGLCVDVLDLLRLLVVIKMKAKRVRGSDWSVVEMFEKSAKKRAEEPAIIVAETGSSATYRELDQRSNQVAHWALGEGLKKGDVVALLMPSCPDYVAIWLGMAKAGVSTALVNVNTKGPALAHAIRTALAQSEGQVVVVDRSLADVLDDDVLAELPDAVRVCVYEREGEEGIESKDDDLRSQIAAMTTEPVPEGTRNGIRWDSTLLLVYTSGTTGLPKASKINHLRFFAGAALFSVSARLRHSDRVYCALPLYHSSGGMLGVGGCWRAGCALVIRGHFSVRLFSRDCVEHGCTAVQYIGEVARYLVNAKENPLDEQCCIRVAFGNGLSPDVWNRFRQRYQVKRICEFYASTEGNVNMVNNTGKVGAVGVIPWFAAKVYPALLLKMDPARENLLRDDEGRCIPCGPGEVGQLVGLINDHDPSRRFDGYTDSNASAKKTVEDVLRPGDKYFASGDLLRKDSFGFYFWVDRMGDTFRWKGENVATTEVAQAVNSFPGVLDVNVYGVEVPGTEGRAGMAAIELNGSCNVEGFDWQGLFQHLGENLPAYAQPQFLRVAEETSVKTNMTATFKHVKTHLRRDGFDPAKIEGEKVLFRDGAAKTFVPLTTQLHEAICSGSARL